ncbi:MAG TPA: POTRA domain-containing protein, partial [Roseateles sp.]
MTLLTAVSHPRLSNVRTYPSSSTTPWSHCALAALLACGLASAVAQTAPPQLPPGAEPGREPLRPVMPQPSLGTPRIEVPHSSAAEPPPGAKEAKFALRELLIDGATAFPADALRPLYTGLLGREVTVAEVFEVANAIELRYRNAGYVTSRVIVPQQTVADGRFRIVVVEGFVADLVYQGDIGPARAAVERLMGSLRGLRPVTLAAIERRLLLANDLPGITVRGSLEPAPNDVGGSLLVVRMERHATEGSATLDNRISPYLGRGQVAGSLAWNGVGERADRVSLHARSSLSVERSHSLVAGYDALVTDAGGMLGLSLSHARSRPGRELEALDVRSRVSSGVFTFSHPLLRGREENLRAMGQLEVRDVSTDIAGTGFTRDRLRIVRAGLSYDRSDSLDGITTVRGTLHQGLSGLGASP